MCDQCSWCHTASCSVAEWLNILLGVEIVGDLRNSVLDVIGGPTFPHGFDAACTKLLWPLVRLVISQTYLAPRSLVS